ncbi:MAG: TerC/Alx family metal homeostasis membrane protein [Crocinitomicaceae bacterium]|jgi:tellurite resistance protein TerC|nr:TerC/Alx family metal homeostasis membrane protein [Crocinitomicaceae bacterium]MCF8410450.1 TerC/Alx family metal homeostasis membrane protein [Crocinitomicaceae bacterium]MCF8445217.1 TerC/Alx family metal homeostasis membrane protein [Crocinitomicaceae bacterium]
MLVWILFIVLIFGLLALDLGVFHKSNKPVSIKESLAWTCVWITVALLFGGVIYWIYDTNFQNMNPTHALPGKTVLDYYTGYVIEESLSLDNIFVIAMIFQFFKIEAKFQHRILFWGILGAVFFRMIMIVLGAAFIESFAAATYIFGGILFYSALRMLKQSDDDNEDFTKSFGIRMLSKVYPIDWKSKSDGYFIKKDGKTVATALFATLVVVEFSDILFAIDSIPAIFSITTDPFIVFSSNIFAIMGLRNLYFFLSNMLDRFHFMKYSLVVVLMFVAIKMLIVDFYHIDAMVSLIVILAALLGGILISLVQPKNKTTN